MGEIILLDALKNLFRGQDFFFLFRGQDFFFYFSTRGDNLKNDFSKATKL